jgi:hypothetical protein
MKYVMCGLALSWIFAGLLAEPGRAQSDSARSAPYCSKADFVHENSDNDLSQETLCLRALAKAADRHRNILTLRLDDGKAKTYQSNPEACQNHDAQACRIYRLIGYHPSARLFMVLASYYEGIDCFLISAHDGRTTKLPDVPHFSPDGSTFIVMDESGFTIGSVASNPPSLTSIEWADAKDSLTWEFRRWLDVDHIALRTDSQSARCPRANCEAVLVRDSTGWKIQHKPAK